MYLDQSLSMYLVGLNFGLRRFLDHTFGLDFRLAKSLHFFGLSRYLDRTFAQRIGLSQVKKWTRPIKHSSYLWTWRFGLVSRYQLVASVWRVRTRMQYCIVFTYIAFVLFIVWLSVITVTLRSRVCCFIDLKLLTGAYDCVQESQNVFWV